jgi:hypothetical protein
MNRSVGTDDPERNVPVQSACCGRHLRSIETLMKHLHLQLTSPQAPIGVTLWWAPLILLVTLNMVGCVSTPAPGAQLMASQWAVDSASAAGGDKAAPAYMRLARDKLSRANAAAAARNHTLARWLAQEAEVDAQLAGVIAFTGGTSWAPVGRTGASLEGADQNMLVQARSDIRLAQEDPRTADWSAAELQRARDAMAKADDALARDADPAEVDHWAYMARQRAATVLQINRLKSVEKVGG